MEGRFKYRGLRAIKVDEREGAEAGTAGVDVYYAGSWIDSSTTFPDSNLEK